MKIGIKLKIDVTKIDKASLFVGKKGKYLDAVVFVDIDNKDQYENNGMITQDAGKDQDKGPILGNVKVFWRDDSNQKQEQHNQGVKQAQEAMAPQQQPAQQHPVAQQHQPTHKQQQPAQQHPIAQQHQPAQQHQLG